MCIIVEIITHMKPRKNPQKQINIGMPINTDMIELKRRLKEIKTKTGKTANAKIAAYILKLAK